MLSGAMSAVPIHTGLSDLAERYDGFIVDLWGVLHDGIRAFPEALACLTELKARGKRVLILSNAPRRAAAVAARNLELGIGPQLYDAVMSSGEETWHHLKTRADPWYRALGRRCFHLGPGRDRGMREGLDYDFVEDIAAADFLLNTGVLSPEHEVGAYTALFRGALERGLPMVCANPDLEVVRGGRREICAGATALHYQELGGEVRTHGKPHRSIYEASLPLLAVERRERIAAIGDSLRTDIAGAQAVGIDGLFVAGGIHGEALGLVDGAAQESGLNAGRLEDLFAGRGITPAAALPVLRW